MKTFFHFTDTLFGTLSLKKGLKPLFTLKNKKNGVEAHGIAPQHRKLKKLHLRGKGEIYYTLRLFAQPHSVVWSIYFKFSSII
jgi:hypothetical protein